VKHLTARAEKPLKPIESRVELAKVKAHAAHTESCAIAFEEELMEQANHHSKLLRGVYLVEHAKRKEPHPENADPPILKGIPLFHMASPHKRMYELVLPTPTTSPRDEGTSRKGDLGDCIKTEEEDP
jgi:hypothetical protein